MSDNTSEIRYILNASNAAEPLKDTAKRRHAYEVVACRKFTFAIHTLAHYSLLIRHPCVISDDDDETLTLDAPWRPEIDCTAAMKETSMVMSAKSLAHSHEISSFN